MKLPKKTVYDNLVEKVNNIDTSGFVLKTKFDTDKQSEKEKLMTQKRKCLILVDLLKKSR